MLADNQFAEQRLNALFEPELRAEILAVGRLQTVEPGAVLMEPGAPMTYVPIVLSGTIKIMRQDTDAELLLYYLRASDTCALSLSILLTGEGSAIRAVVDEKAVVVLIPARLADEWLGRYPGWRQFVFRTYQQRFDDLLETFDSVAFRQLDERLVAYLTRKAAVTGGRHLYLTHDDIARDLNTSREVVSRLLKQLERLGRVALTRNKVSLLPPL